MQAIERKLNQNLAKNPELVKFLNISSLPTPYIRKYAKFHSDYIDLSFDIMLSII